MNRESKVYFITNSKKDKPSVATFPKSEQVVLIHENNIEEYEIALKAKIALAAESAIDVITPIIKGSDKEKTFLLLKDKAAFRSIIKTLYPDFIYQKVNAAYIHQISCTKKSVLKPIKGFFGTGVYIVDEKTDFAKLQNEINESQHEHNTSVVDTAEFLLEEFIEGEEYAVDMFYNELGEACIVNIFHHPIPKHREYFHMIYTTSKTIVEELYEPALQFYTRLNSILKITNFPIHGEFKFHQGKLVPIEMNPMRFGGLGLGHSLYYNLGINPYECFAKNAPADLKSFWSKQNEDLVFVHFLAYHGTDYMSSHARPNIDKLKNQFSSILNEIVIKDKSEPVFAAYVLRETNDSIKRLLTLDMNDFYEE